MPVFWKTARAWAYAELLSTFSLTWISATFLLIDPDSLTARSASWFAVCEARFAAASASASRLTVPPCSWFSSSMIDARFRNCCGSVVCSSCSVALKPPFMYP